MRTFIRWLPALLMVLIIFLLSSRHGTVVSNVYVWNYIANKFAHIGLYFVLTFTFYRATKSILLAFLAVVTYAVIDETHQAFVPTRSGKWQDVLLDSAASGYAVLVLWKFYPYLPTRLKNWLNY
uniref:VanZ family protein n=1 Tax=candidate division WWE3 bacterium TaxID=2053526 RepID=A0A7C4XNI5_UNCKA